MGPAKKNQLSDYEMQRAKIIGREYEDFEQHSPRTGKGGNVAGTSERSFICTNRFTSLQPSQEIRWRKVVKKKKKKPAEASPKKAPSIETGRKEEGAGVIDGRRKSKRKKRNLFLKLCSSPGN